ncbi:MAG: DUF393 domain-containing protein [Pseudomonadota bacterium]
MRTTPFPLTLLYDGACAVCALEMDHLRERSRDGKLVFIDISQAGFDAADHGLQYADLDAEIHGIQPDGTVLKGIGVLRLAYQAAGMGWVLSFTGWPLLRPCFDVGYRLFARHRQRISGTLAPLIHGVRGWRAEQRARRVAQRMQACHDGQCDVGGTPAAAQPGARPVASTSNGQGEPS